MIITLVECQGKVGELEGKIGEDGKGNDRKKEDEKELSIKLKGSTELYNRGVGLGGTSLLREW